MLVQLRKCLRYRDGHMWEKVCQGRILLSLYDHVLGSDWGIPKTVVIRDPCDFSSDHFALWAHLLLRPT